MLKGTYTSGLVLQYGHDLPYLYKTYFEVFAKFHARGCLHSCDIGQSACNYNYR